MSDIQKLFSEINRRYLADHRNDVYDRSLPDEAVQLIREKGDDLIDYAIKHNKSENEYEFMLGDSRELLDEMYSYLDVPTLERHKGNNKLDYRGKPKKLWRTYTDEVFTHGCKIWEMKDSPDYYHYSPVATECLDELVGKYLAQPWINHPYISWALINAILLDAGRRQIMNFDTEFSDDVFNKNLSSDTTKLIKQITNTNKPDIGVFLGMIEDNTSYETLKRAFDRKLKTMVINDIIILIVGVSVLYYFEYYKTLYTFAALYVLLSWIGRRFQRKETAECITNIDRIRGKLSTLKEAWLTANCEAVSLVRLKEKVNEAELAGNKFPASLHALIENTISKYGNSISVSGWI